MSRDSGTHIIYIGVTHATIGAYIIFCQTLFVADGAL